MATKKPSGLGRGLGALLGDDVLKPEAAGNLYLPISQVENYTAQPRKQFDEAALAELADSIREHGVMNAILCDEIPPDLSAVPAYAVAGVVEEVNTQLEDEPQMLNEDPYGAWIARIRDISACGELMSADEYEAFVQQ